MSKRCFNSLASRAIRVATIVLLLLLSVSGTLLAQADSALPYLHINRVYNIPLGHDAFVDITYGSMQSQLGLSGFDLLIAYDSSALTFESAEAGPLMDSCGWEYFSYQKGPFSCQGPCPDGMLRLSGTADINNGSLHPSCFLNGSTGTLATMKFHVTSDPLYDCQLIAIRFGWLDCSDNTLPSVTGDTLFYSAQVFEFQADPYTSPNYDFTWLDCAFPFRYGGTCPDCDTSTLPAGMQRARRLVFWNGFIDIQCSDSLSSRGDINLNLVPYEIADLVLFMNYAIYGIDAFSPVNRDKAIANSDVNADGRVLTFQDLTFLMRVVTGDTIPVPKLRDLGDLKTFVFQDTVNHSVEITCSDLLAGASFKVLGNITPTFLLPLGMSQDFNFDGTYTTILILGNPEHRYGSGTWFTYTGTGVLKSVEAADWHDSDVKARISQVAFVCGDFDLSGGTDISDAVYAIAYIFGGGPEPLDIRGGDVNCDNSSDISDVVYLIAYIFGGGPAPCNGC